MLNTFCGGGTFEVDLFYYYRPSFIDDQFKSVNVSVKRNLAFGVLLLLQRTQV